MLEIVCSISIIAAWMSACTPSTPQLVGYVEGEYVRLAPLEAAHVATLHVSRGDMVEKGQKLATMENDDALLELQGADAQLEQARADLANLRQGRRPAELAVIEAALSSARANAEDARRAYERQADLFRRGVTSRATLDSLKTAFDTAVAAVEQQQASLSVAQLAARPDEIIAAENRVKQAQASRDSAEWRLQQREILSPASGEVTSLIRRPGEAAGPTAPVLELLPSNATKLMLYIPEASYALYSVGQVLDVKCDGCPAGLTATVARKATQAEFTPPVIYSTDARQKLVYLMEAKPAANAAALLRPGQIVDVSPKP